LATKKEVASARKELKSDYRNKHRAAIAKSGSDQSAFCWAFGWDMAHYSLRAKSFDAASLGILGFAAACRSGLIADDRRKNSPVEWLRDIFGNPFQPLPTIDSSWLSWNDRSIRKLAQAIYDDRTFDRLPILADALEESGCHNEDILAHCRAPGPHVRGCWIVDLVLGKE